MIELDYEKDISIDESALDLEWLRQPDLMWKYCKYSALAKKSLDEAKERLDFVRAKLEMEIRKDPGSFGVDRVTESAISSAIISHPDYERAQRKLIEARYEAEIASGAIRALEHKKSALENLVRLYAASYFAGPSVPRDIVSERRKREQDRREQNRKVRIRQ